LINLRSTAITTDFASQRNGLQASPSCGNVLAPARSHRRIRRRTHDRTFLHLAKWALLSALFAALTAIFAKIGVENIHPDLATFIRTAIVLLAFAFLLAATGQYVMPTSVPARTWVFLVLSGLATGASWLCYFRALKLGPATLVAPIDKLSVVLVALFAFVFLGERPSPTGWLGICLIAAGSVLIVIRA
jgi:bacterial/archaeal transporter family protein